MKNLPVGFTNLSKASLRAAVVSLSALSLSACMGSTADLWQGDDIIVEARQEVLERDVYNVSDDHRALKDRFNALERLYVELVHQMRVQTAKMASLDAKMTNVEKDPEAVAQLTRMKNDVSMMREQMKKLENRVFSVEMAETSTQQPLNTATNMAGNAPATTNVGTAQANTAVATNTPSVPVNNNAAPKQTFYGVHLASYRSQEQVDSGWAGLMETFAGNLEGLTPLIYTQSQEGIGTFLRLIAGPLISEQEANSLCGRIRETATEQYCRVSEYQGEPVE
jgi:TolA-binding protein